MMKIKILIILLTSFFIFSLIYAQPQIKREEIQRGVPQQQREHQISDDPVIREFSANPTGVVQGGQVTFSWRVEPTPGGSPITDIRITVGAIELHRSSSAVGEKRIVLPSTLAPQLACQIVLTATNSAGRSKQRTLNLEIFADTPVIREFSVEPDVVMAGGEFKMRWRVEPRPGGSRITNVRIGPDTVLSSGERTIRIDRNNFDERRRYTLVATSERAQSVSQTREVEIKSILSVKTSIQNFHMTMEPREIPEDIRGSFIITFENLSGITIEGVSITLVSKPEEVSRGALRGKIVGGLSNQTIRPGMNEFRISGVISSRGFTPKPRFMGIILDLSPQPEDRMEATTPIEVRTIESYHLRNRGDFRTIFH
ncbi:MAG: hypothetical protein QMD43_05405 [Thermodesulfovibrio sp.]|uniref:hypothetical protein n=1 Tax=unclassified Thermodesulfovibrio TaxID=2645936 RepID=UPI00117DB7A7|nr:MULTISPECIES: hypothetical protein [unclassified Thermodesulfovibrio]MDI1472516.1 hypothetical protein [Thermodesulfovibrio sp. 1176]MDI6714447.1 hypothetical protein [Thermodesulfovibrio sp.]